MKKCIKILGVAMLLFVGVSCSDDDESNSVDMVPVPVRFEAQLNGDMDMETLLDTETNLIWVNDVRGCFAGIVNPTTQCEDLVFGGSSDWRLPSPEELATLIKAIDERGMSLNYINSSCALMSTNDAVWVFTENSDAPGEMTMMEPGNAGVRCVKEN